MFESFVCGVRIVYDFQVNKRTENENIIHLIVIKIFYRFEYTVGQYTQCCCETPAEMVLVFLFYCRQTLYAMY